MAPRQDPRRISNPGTANEAIQDRMIRHLLYLTRLATGEAGWMDERIMREYIPAIENEAAQLVNRLTSQGQPGVLTERQTRDINTFARDVGAASAALMTDIRSRYLDRLVEIARSEVQFELGLFRSAIPVELNFSVPSDDQLRMLLANQPFDGQPLSDWFTDLDARTIRNVTGAVRQGMIEGESMDAIMRRIRGTRAGNYTDGVLSTTRHHAESLARSGVIHSSNQATNQMYRENDDLIKAVKVVATLDSRTCQTCAGYEEGGPYEVENHPTPPFHPNCRCVTVPVFKSWREMGIDLDEAPPGTRSSMDGQVPEDLTYNQWLKRQPREVVEEALGPTRARLFLDGDLSVSAFTDRTGRSFTLEELWGRERDIITEVFDSDEDTFLTQFGWFAN
jgi:SPP1 gp7 family putative phage head morphogenesis protein